MNEERHRTGWLMDEEAMLDAYEGVECTDCGMRGDDCDCIDLDPQEVCVGMLLSKGNVKDIENVMKAKADEAMTLALKHLQDFLGVQSGDQACYFIDDEEENKVKEWLFDYAMSEVQLYTPFHHPLYDEMVKVWSTDGLRAKFL